MSTSKWIAAEAGHESIDPRRDLTVVGERLERVSFSGRRLRSFRAWNAEFVRCQFENMVSIAVHSAPAPREPPTGTAALIDPACV